MEKTTTENRESIEKPKYFAKRDGVGYGGVDLDRGQIVAYYAEDGQLKRFDYGQRYG